ncbi:acyltransferase family protein [Nocardioides gilvus]|uniref:acyltransferase family protein n=1 Tax=Nocardioides gilvus TaxID=1735589 RepID=UPI000D74E206|nr:acyltransferase family protein [Nocardioides gilvus]
MSTTLQAPAPTKSVRAPRTDIQGLRALAVSMVLIYHVAPASLTGGFVGVDVFFVISGFLITSHLLTRTPRTGRDFVDFWARRIRRLLPASLLVLAVTVVATWLLGPETLWENTARQAGAATLYSVNWLLAADAVDYLAAENAATGVQHYWSLAVEEQFYLVWPLLIGLLALIARRSGWRRELVWATGLGAVALASLVWSVRLTASDPGRAYFESPTRVWELAAGGLVALALLHRTERPPTPGTRASFLAVGLGWAGLGAIAVAGLTFDARTPFPSWTAALPVLGTCAVIAARADARWWSPGGVLALRPAQWLGDISYSVYLWHWPLVVLVGALSAPLGLLDAAGIVVLSLGLAALTKKYVEDPFRTASWNRRTGATYGFGAAAMAVVLVLAGALWLHVQDRQEAAEAQVREALAEADPCLGAGALDPDQTCSEPSGAPIPTPLQASSDKSQAYGDVSGGQDCWSSQPSFPLLTCDFGDVDAAHDVVLLGNSHAGHWLPALQQIATGRDWRITTMLASQCASTDADLEFSTPARSDACRDWTETAVEEIVERSPDLVVMSNRVSLPLAGATYEQSAAGYADGYERVLRRLAEAGVAVAVLRDTPAPGDGGEITSIPDCLAEHLPDAAACGGPRDDWVSFDPDPAATAATRIADKGVGVVDLNDRICRAQNCDAVVGGVIVYFDASHLTATYARTLAPALDRALVSGGLMPR